MTTTKLRTRLEPYLAQLKSRQMTNRKVAKLLDVTEAHLSRTLKDMGFERDPPVDREAAASINRMRLEHRAQAAASNKSLAQAALDANVSIRTMYRYRKKLAEKAKTP